MGSNIIIHVSEVNVSPNSGMGRVEYYWKQAFEKAGFDFVHIGPDEVGPLKHPALFPFKAYQYYRKLKITPLAFIVHEPAGGFFVKRGIPCLIESHGVERRYWDAQLDGSVPPATNKPISLKTKLLLPLWRFYGCDKGLKYADKLLLINSEDKAYVKKRYLRDEEDIFIFKNGATAVPESSPNNDRDSTFTILFNGNWLDRKGINVLIASAKALLESGVTNVHYLLIGTGKDAETVLSDWPAKLRPFVKVINRFNAKDESDFLSTASLFVLPSYFEGQPLSLLQAMAAGKCCITTNCCGQKDIIDNGDTGLLFEPGDHKELAALIGKCYHDRALLKNIGANAREYTKNITWDKVSGQVAEFVLASVKK